MNVISWFDQRRKWWKTFVLIFAVSVTVAGYIGYKTYEYAPPIANFVNEQGETVFPARSITDGQQVFFRYGLMDYGSYLGDGGLRGPDFTAESLHLTARWMNEYYAQQETDRPADHRGRRMQAEMLKVRVQFDLKVNRYDPTSNSVTLNDAQVFAFHQLLEYYTQKFGQGGELAKLEQFKPANYITDPQELKDLTAFFFWGGWLCAAERPGFDYSFTHNWPFDPLAGNTPTPGVVLWSVIGGLVLILALGVIFYYYGKMDREALLETKKAKRPPLATVEAVNAFRPTPTQRAC
jgi:nitric oxide reductase subunit B